MRVVDLCHHLQYRAQHKLPTEWYINMHNAMLTHLSSENEKVHPSRSVHIWSNFFLFTGSNNIQTAICMLKWTKVVIVLSC